jgi:FkbM family methyltransferase
VFERSLHSLLNFFDRSLPSGVKRRIKRASPQLVETFYRQVTRFTPDRIVEVRIQDGRLGGRRFFCSLRHQRSCFLGNFEPQKEAVLADYLGPGKVFFDVGGHIGYFSLMAATLVQPNGTVVACEPSPANAAQFKQNLEVNPDLARVVRLEETAVADDVGVASFDRGGNSYIGHLVADSNASGLKVNTTTLDTLAAAHGLSPDFVKIDAEGAESLIFRGMTQILTRARPVLLVEIHDVSSYDNFVELLARHSYAARRLDGEHGFSVQPEFVAEAEYLAIPR